MEGLIILAALVLGLFWFFRSIRQKPKVAPPPAISGITLTMGGATLERLKPDPSASQTAPRRCYVYAHLDEHGKRFYIGKGTARRAWEGDRHPMWHRYVQTHLAGKYSIVILKDDLESTEAEELENAWIAQEAETLVNWVNFGRKIDYRALDYYHQLRNANRERLRTARKLESDNSDRAINIYFTALEKLDEYATIQPESGLIGSLIDEERREDGTEGDLHILNRLTLCLVRAGRAEEAAEVARSYFKKYRIDRSRRAAEPIVKRLNKHSSFRE